MQSRLSRWAFERGGLLALVAVSAYLALAGPYVVDGDNAEFATLGALGGAAHPPGYPLYLLLLRALAWLPGSTPAHTAALATAVMAGAAVLVLHAAVRAWGAQPLAATITVALFAASPLVVRLATQAEVFALANLVAAMVLWLAAAGGPLRGSARAAALGLVAGLGLCDQLTCALLAPVGILGVIRGAREARVAWQAIALAIAGLAAGFVPYAYLAITAENPVAWGRHLDSVAALLHHFLREDYGGPGAFAPDPEPVSAASNLGALARMLGRTWLWLPLAAGLVALVDRVRRGDAAGESRWMWAMLAASFALAGPLLITRFDVTHEGPGLYVIERFMILPALLLAPAIAVAFDFVLARARVADRIAARPTLAHVLAAAIFVAAAASSLRYVQEAHAPIVERSVRNMLASLPERAVVIVYEDDLGFGSGYVQALYGLRPDVLVIMSTAVSLPRNRERIAERLAIELPPGTLRLGPGFADAVLASGRPLLVDSLAEDILAARPSYPFGILHRVLPAGTAPPSPGAVLAENKALFEHMTFGPPPSGDADWPVHAQVRYVMTWQRIGDALAAAGQPDDAESAYAIGRALVPIL